MLSTVGLHNSLVGGGPCWHDRACSVQWDFTSQRQLEHGLVDDGFPLVFKQGSGQIQIMMTCSSMKGSLVSKRSSIAQLLCQQ